MSRSRPGGILPPWIWLFLTLYLVWALPGQFRTLHWRIVEYSGRGDTPSEITSQASFTLLKVFLVVEFLPIALLVAGIAGVAFPGLRARYVERRLGLVAAADRPVIAEMQRFVDGYAPGTTLRFTLRADRLARTYPIGWRRARIAVFRPLVTLWRRDPQAARAVLLHETAHIRQGDHLVVGLGSPFPWIVRAWTPVFLVLSLVPVLVYFFLAPRPLSAALAAQVIVDSTLVVRTMLLPVAALWLAELSADRFPVQLLGEPALRRGLEAGHGSGVWTLLSHPPLAVRRRLAAPRPLGTVALLAGWPVALLLSLCVALAAAAPAYLLIGRSVADTLTGLARGVHVFLVDSRPLTAAIVVVLVAWPYVTHAWTRWWIPAAPSVPADAPRLYLTAAALPALVLLASLVPAP